MEKTQIYKKNKDFQPVLQIVDQDGKSHEVILKDKMILGRPVADHIPDIPLFSKLVSRVHGEFGILEGKCFYRDLDSHNGTWLNGEQCYEAVQLKDGDVLTIRPGRQGNLGVEITLTYRESNTCAQKAMYSVQGNNISAVTQENSFSVPGNNISSNTENSLKTSVIQDRCLQIHIDKREARVGFRKKTLLKDIHLDVSSGEMVLILGGSGAGKTTFINAVMGYEEADGQILFNGKNVYEDYEEMKYEIAYVPQQDLVRGADTVWGTLCSAAQMRMPAHAELHQKICHAQEVLELFGLEREKDMLVSKLSGGQRKRLSIAVEYIGNPSLFFLDEPDSGLDGVMARSLMENLREIGNMGKIIMVISHNPDRVADLFDKIIVLAKSDEDDAGHLAFYGNIDDAKTFFQVQTLEEIVKRINRPDEGGDGRADAYIRKFQEDYQ